MGFQTEPSPELIDQAQSCSQSAENELFRFLNARILAIAQKRLWGRELAKDVAQQVLMVLCAPNKMSGKRQYKTIERERFMPWVFQIVRNKMGDTIRQIRNQKTIPLEGLSVDPLILDEGRDEAERKLEMHLLLSKTLPRLDKKCREILRAWIEETRGNPLPEKFAKLPKTTWHPRKSRCLKKLRELLRKEGLSR